MVKKSTENGQSVPPFLLKCYEMVDDRSTDSLISWGSTDDCFIIWDATRFSSQLLPKYFKHNTFSSFVRQLNIYVSFFFSFLLFICILSLICFLVLLIGDSFGIYLNSRICKYKGFKIIYGT